MPDESRANQPCCEGSLEAGEPLFATASRVDVWLLLEHNAAWGAKALPESSLPDNLKTFLNHNLESIPNSRFQFIKQSGVMAGNPRFYVVRSSPENSAIYEFRLSLDELLKLDISAILAGSSQFQSNLYTAPLFLICTNAKRDLSCARYGLPLYQAMSAHAGQSVWQTTHLGGHRFAGTMAVLPEGLYYGRVAPDDAENLVIEHQAGRIYLDHFRGHSIYESPAQAAEYFLREHTGNLNINDLRLLNLEANGENRWAVQFVIGAQTHTLQVSSYLSDFEIFESTSNTEKNRVTLYRLDSYEPGTANA
jgi:hypothetical protein